MKLFTRINIFFIITSVVLLIISGIIFFFYIQKISDEELNEKIYFEKEKLQEYVNQHKSLPNTQFLLGDSIYILQTNKIIIERLFDTLILSRYEQELIPCRILEFSVSDSIATYKAGIIKPSLEKDDLEEAVLNSVALLGILLVVTIFLTNFFFLRKLWKPFYSTLQKISSYKIGRGLLVLDATSVTEFQKLHSTLDIMIQKMESDFKATKEFTANAAHEMQTPIAIVKTKLELLLQKNNEIPDPNLVAAYENLNRLSKLIQSLLMLSKIENRQYQEMKIIRIDELFHDKIIQMADFIELKQLQITENYSQKMEAMLNPVLADMLAGNLIGNAIKHNTTKGYIQIKCEKSILTICNSGASLNEKPEMYFERFRKNNNDSQSTGLGLSIVKEICNTYNIMVSYTCSGNEHYLSLDFGNIKEI